MPNPSPNLSLPEGSQQLMIGQMEKIEFIHSEKKRAGRVLPHSPGLKIFSGFHVELTLY